MSSNVTMWQSQRNVERRYAREQANALEQIKTRGAEARKTDTNRLEFNRDNMTAYQRGKIINDKIDSNRRQMNSDRTYQRNLFNDRLDQANKDRTYQRNLFNDRLDQANKDRTYQRNLSNDRFNRFDKNRSFRQGAMEADRFTFEDKYGNTKVGYYSDSHSEGNKLFLDMAASKDHNAFFEKLEPEQRLKIKGYKDSLRERGIDSSNWSANRLKRSMGENQNRGAMQRYADATARTMAISQGYTDNGRRQEQQDIYQMADGTWTNHLKGQKKIGSTIYKGDGTKGRVLSNPETTRPPIRQSIGERARGGTGLTRRAPAFVPQGPSFTERRAGQIRQMTPQGNEYEQIGRAVHNIWGSVLRGPGGTGVTPMYNRRTGTFQ